MPSGPGCCPDGNAMLYRHDAHSWALAAVPAEDAPLDALASVRFCPWCGVGLPFAVVARLDTPGGPVSFPTAAAFLTPIFPNWKDGTDVDCVNCTVEPDADSKTFRVDPPPEGER